MSDKFLDEELLKKIADPETSEYGFRQLVEKYQRKLYAHIRRITGNHEDTDDVLQETFIKAWSKIGTYRHESPLYYWLISIATNEALINIRKNKMRSLFSFDIRKLDEKKIPVQLSTPGAGEIEKKLNHAMNSLGTKQKIIFGMRYFDELPYQEIAKILNKSEGTIKATYHQAFIKIKNHLENSGQ